MNLDPGAALLHGFALPRATALLAAVARIAATVPFRHMATPGGRAMSVASTSCGEAGWVTDRSGYRYVACDPSTRQKWPAMPTFFAELAAQAAAASGFDAFSPDACLINRYVPGAHLSLHQDKDELDFSQPIVSVSLGLPAVFLWGGRTRAERPRRVPLDHGDVVVWGGAARMHYHGVQTLAHGVHPQTAAVRYNLTFRKAL